MQEVTDRTEQQQRSIDELTDTIAGRNEKCEALKRETEGLKRDLDGRELPFLYTAVPLASSDMYGPSWRFVARQPSLAGGAPAGHPAAQWEQGRPYLVGAVNQSEARRSEEHTSELPSLMRIPYAVLWLKKKNK